MGKEQSVKGLIESVNKYVNGFQNKVFPLITTGGRLSEGIITFNPPTLENQVRDKFENQNLFAPNDLIEFYTISDGAIMYKHPKYGGGTEILSLERVFKLQSECDNIPETWYPITWTDHPSGSICIDSVKCKNNEFPYLFFLGAINHPEDAIPIQGDFSTWLSRLIVCQGEDFWMWDYYDNISFHRRKL